MNEPEQTWDSPSLGSPRRRRSVRAAEGPPGAGALDPYTAGSLPPTEEPTIAEPYGTRTATRRDEPPAAAEAERVIELREEQLVPHREWRDVGDVEIRKRVEEVPGRVEIDAYREEVEVEHVPVGQVVAERREPWHEEGTLVVPVYEEQLVVVKRLYLREHLRIRRLATTERQVFEESLKRERVEVDDPTHSGLVHERHPTGRTAGEPDPHESREPRSRVEPTPPAREEGGLLDNLRRAMR